MREFVDESRKISQNLMYFSRVFVTDFLEYGDV